MRFEGSIRCSFQLMVWNSEAPLKCRLFAWLAILGKCNTTDCLMKNGWPHNAACVRCLGEQESALHLLATCNVAWLIWRKVLTTAGLPLHLAPNTNTLKLQNWLLSTTQPTTKATKELDISCSLNLVDYLERTQCPDIPEFCRFP